MLHPIQSYAADQKNISFEQTKASIEEVLIELSGLLDRFDAFQRDLDRSGRNNNSYDEEKKMWLSAVLAVTTIAAVCEYENDLLILLLDLKPERRSYFYDVRLQSLDSSIRQIKIMKEQLRINYSLISNKSKEKALFQEIEHTIDQVVDLLTASHTAIVDLKQSITN